MRLCAWLLVVLIRLVRGGPCTVCRDGDKMSMPDEILTIPGYPELPCTSVDATLAILVPNETSNACTTIQSLGSLCGCPIRDDACAMCRSGDTARHPDKELPFLSDLFLGSIPTCQTVEAYLKSISKTNSMCTASQKLLTEYCGCDSETKIDNDQSAPPCSLCSDGTPFVSNDRNITVPGFPFNTCRQLEDALYLLLNADSQECTLLSQAFSSYCGCKKQQDFCSLCRDGSPVSLPNNTFEWIGDKRNFLGVTPTCDVYESFVSGYSEEDQQCTDARLLGTMCGCPPIADHCTFCPGESMPEAYLNTSIKELTYVYDFEATCSQAESFLQYQVPESSHECFLGQHGNFLCGCSNGIYSYFGANTPKKQAGLTWTPRASALLSLICCWTFSRRERKGMRYTGMSCFDIIGCVAWGATTLAVPRNGDFGAYIHGARGNDITCTIQGFLMQLSLTAIFYNISLSTYYLLVIVYSWRNDRLKNNNWWIHGIPITLGFGLALGGIPYYRSNVVFCHIQNPPVESSWYPLVFFSFVPIFAAISFTTVMMCRVYFKVREQSRRSAAWNFENARLALNQQPRRQRQSFSNIWNSRVGAAQSSAPSPIARLERDVFVQSLLYLSAFYFSWSFYLAAILRASPSNRNSSSDLDNLYWFYLVCFFMLPLQGFWNAVIYFRHRWLRNLRSYTKNTKSITARFFSSMHFRPKVQRRELERRVSNEHLHADESNNIESSEHYDDPSTLIAEVGAVVNDINNTEANHREKSFLHLADDESVDGRSKAICHGSSEVELAAPSLNLEDGKVNSCERDNIHM